jgi:hypothetical protein
MLQHTFPIFYGNRIALVENTTFHFYGSDSKEKFFTNRARLGESWKYYDSLVQLTYKSDNYGFRNHHSLDVIQHAPYIVTIGCSHTMGTGIHHEDTYSCHLENLAGIPVYNMGLGGSSNEVRFLNLVWLLTNFNPPKTIVFQQTGMSRFPLISQNKTISFEGPWSAKDNNDLRDFMILSDTFGYNNTKFLLLEIMLRQLTTKHGVNLYAIPDQISVLRANTSCSELARDLVHSGKDFNEFLAKYIWSNISNK